MEQYAIYLRKSRADVELEATGEMETLARHEKILLGTAKKLKLPVTKIYKEIVSGETIEARPVVRQLIDEVEQGIWAGVLVMEIERLARGDTIDQGIIARAFKYHNTNIITPAKTYDPGNEFDEEYFEFGLFMSRREYKTINRRIQRGRITSASEGKFVGSTPPYGYDRLKITGEKGYTLAPNQEADVVRLIYNLYISGLGMTSISNKLDEMQIKPRYRENWSKSTISDILKNPVYIGKIRWSFRQDKRQNIDGKLVSRRTKNTDCILVEGLHPAIVSIEDFTNVQKILELNRSQPVKKDLMLKNPFTGLIYCKICGGAMTRLGANKRNKYDTLKCSNRYCDNVSAPMFLIEERVLEILQSWLIRYEVSVDDKATKADVKIKQQAIKDINGRLDKIDKQIDKTHDLLELGVYDIDIFTKRHKTLAEQKNELQQSLEGLKTEIATDASNVLIAPLLKSVLSGYDNIDSAKQKNMLLRHVIAHMDYVKHVPNRRGQLHNDNFELTIHPKF